jgi:hypothetical protein
MTVKENKDLSKAVDYRREAEYGLEVVGPSASGTMQEVRTKWC